MTQGDDAREDHLRNMQYNALIAKLYTRYNASHVDAVETSAHRAARPAATRRSLCGVPADPLSAVPEHLVCHFGGEQAVRRKCITLIGLRGAGKSTLGAALAKEMRRIFVELDREIEAEAAMELSEIFFLYGQPGFRRLERRCLQSIIDSQRDVVVSIGGGAVLEPRTLQLLLTNCFTVWLKASPADHMARVLAQGDTRPMKGRVRAMQELKDILGSREQLYARADATVDTSGKSIEESLIDLRRACVQLVN